MPTDNEKLDSLIEYLTQVGPEGGYPGEVTWVGKDEPNTVVISAVRADEPEVQVFTESELLHLYDRAAEIFQESPEDFSSIEDCFYEAEVETER